MRSPRSVPSWAPSSRRSHPARARPLLFRHRRSRGHSIQLTRGTLTNTPRHAHATKTKALSLDARSIDVSRLYDVTQREVKIIKKGLATGRPEASRAGHRDVQRP